MRKDRVVSEVLGEDQALTPSEVCNKQFRRATVGGYAAAEVDAYLARVADVLETLINQSRALKERCEEQKARIEEFHEMELTLRSALTSSQKFAENVVEAAKREAAALLEQAKLEQTRARIEADKLPESLSREIQQLRSQRERLRSELTAILDAHRSLLGYLDKKTELSAGSDHSTRWEKEVVD